MYWKENDNKILFWFLCLFIIRSQCKYGRIENESLVFINIFLIFSAFALFISKLHPWTTFNAFMKLREIARHTPM